MTKESSKSLHLTSRNKQILNIFAKKKWQAVALLFPPSFIHFSTPPPSLWQPMKRLTRKGKRRKERECGVGLYKVLGVWDISYVSPKRKVAETGRQMGWGEEKVWDSPCVCWGSGRMEERRQRRAHKRREVPLTERGRESSRAWHLG